MTDRELLFDLKESLGTCENDGDVAEQIAKINRHLGLDENDGLDDEEDY